VCEADRCEAPAWVRDPEDEVGGCVTDVCQFRVDLRVTMPFPDGD
jgi:hypothetical protein